MATETTKPIRLNAPSPIHPGWILFLTIAFGILLPLVGTQMLENALPRWQAASTPLHSTLEVMGAVFGLVLAIVILFSRHRKCASRGQKIACALISMSVLDIFHSCVQAGNSFVWLHSLAVLAGGIFFACVWLPDREMARGQAASRAASVLLGSVLVATLSLLHPDWVPPMVVNGRFTLAASALNVIGGGLTLVGGFAFAFFYYKKQELEDLFFLSLCILFGSSGIIFYYANIWDAGWWFWHVIRFGAYLLPFWLVVFADHLAENKAIANQIKMAAAIADGDYSVNITPQHDQDELGMTLRSMSLVLRENRQHRNEQDWLKTGISQLSEVISGDQALTSLAANAISELTTYCDAQIGALYLLDEKTGTLKLTGSYAYTNRKNLSNRFKLGEGLVGQVALEKQQILIKNIPEDYIRIRSQLGERVPRFICVSPCLHEGRVKGVIEIGSFTEFSEQQLEYLSHVVDVLGRALESAEGRTQLAVALEDSQALAKKLQTQQEELKASNEELEEQTQALRQSEEELKSQQEELQVTNEELEEKTEYLKRQKQELMDAAEELEQKAAELARTSKYKSEFLANMSHELRTPLNSLLILASLLEENTDGNLTAEQVESAHVIHGCGKDLLSLINEILDLSKIEAGQMSLLIEPVSVDKLAEEIRRGFRHVFDSKGLKFKVNIQNGSPTQIISDRKRIGQILKNLISNAGKFTEKGSVTVTFSSGTLRREPCLIISVKDTGMGIPADKQKLVFEAFQQAEGSITRKYGGTGLGLSISREMARVLGGEIRLKSTPKKGSVFSVHLPLNAETVISEQGTDTPPAPTKKRTRPSVRLENPVFGSVPDDRDNLKQTDKAILVVEDDSTFAKILLQQCHDKDLKCLIASTGEEGLYLAENYLPDAVILDLKLPGIDGWSVLDQLKDNIKTRHIPVHIMSAENPSQNVLNNGAIGFLKKPVGTGELQEAFERIEDVLERKMKDLLVIEDDATLRKAILKLIGNGDVIGSGAGTGQEALEQLRSKKHDCIVLDLNLPDMTGFEFLEKAEADQDITLPPVIVYTGRELTREEEAALINYSESIIVKGVRSQERLFDEVSLFLHRMVKKMPDQKRKMIANLHDANQMFLNKKVLIVDDDMRNLFALSNSLSAKGVQTIKAQDGQKALDELEKNPDIELVLIDIMMPSMDGYETMGHIRKQNRFAHLPIIALTAKAMKADRQKCIEAGANDYLSKPVDLDRLFSMMRVWMYR